MKKILESFVFWKRKKIDKVQIAYHVFMESLKESNYIAYAKTAGNVNEDLFVVFRGKKNSWVFRILLPKDSSDTHHFFTNPPESIRHVLCDLTFEEAVRLIHLLKPEMDSEYEIPDFIKPRSEHISVISGSPPRVS